MLDSLEFNDLLHVETGSHGRHVNIAWLPDTLYGEEGSRIIRF